ncbi:MAG: CoA transferase [Syntrophomonadaceae bacterium]|nr:CoA transferase [Syntrophomonadaceae bacterium]
MEDKGLPLRGLKVLDISTMIAAPWAATYMGDFGADVIKVEHPVTGDNIRKFGAAKDGKGVYWKSLNRNKKCITLELKKPEGKELFLKLVTWADVLIENFRPGTMEKWGLGWEVLKAANPGLIWLRVSAFGQEGPYAARGGFGTVAEGMSGYAAINGYPDGPPTLPPIALADGVCSAFAAYAIMVAVYERDVLGSKQGQVIDISLYEPLMRLMEVSLMEYSTLGLTTQRMGNRIASSAPRNSYKTKEGKWICLSGSAQPIAENIFKAIGRPDLINDYRFCNNFSRIKNVDELDAIIGEWIGRHSLDEVIERFMEAGAVIGPIYEVDQIFADEHFKYRESLVQIPDKDFGTITMPNVFAKLSRTPGKIQFSGEDKGAHNQEVYCDLLGLSLDELNELQTKEVI